MAINLKSLNHYLSLYTDVNVKKEWNQLVFWNTILDIKDKHVAMAIYSSAIANMLEAKELTTIKVFYLQDLITMYFKEIAKLNDIDPWAYRWSADLIKQFPEYWVFYNTIEWFKQHLDALSSWTKTGKIDFPQDFLLDVLKKDFSKYIQSSDTPEQKADEAVTISHCKSFDDIL